jgi:hypothetical protein
MLAAAAGAAGRTRRAPAAAASGDELEVSELRYQGYVGVVSLIELADDLGYLAPLKLHYVGSTLGGPQDIQTVVTGDIDFGGPFNGSILELVAARAPIRAVVDGIAQTEALADGPSHLGGQGDHQRTVRRGPLLPAGRTDLRHPDRAAGHDGRYRTFSPGFVHHIFSRLVCR